MRLDYVFSFMLKKKNNKSYNLSITYWNKYKIITSCISLLQAVAFQRKRENIPNTYFLLTLFCCFQTIPAWLFSYFGCYGTIFFYFFSYRTLCIPRPLLCDIINGKPLFNFKLQNISRCVYLRYYINKHIFLAPY